MVFSLGRVEWHATKVNKTRDGIKCNPVTDMNYLRHHNPFNSLVNVLLAKFQEVRATVSNVTMEGGVIRIGSHPGVTAPRPTLDSTAR